MLSFIKKPEAVGTSSTPAMPLTECLAKTYLSDEGKSIAGRTVFNHCQIVGEVARELIKRMPAWLQEKLFPPGSELIAAAHDIGKISPTFQEKIYRAIEGYQQNSKPGLEQTDPELERNWGYHGGVSQATASAVSLGEYIPKILGQHHGYSPDLKGLIAGDQVFGGSDWQMRRCELLSELKLALNCDWPQISSPLQARVLSGLTTVADWIGSSFWFEDPQQCWRSRVQEALDHAGFIPPLLISDLSFADIFDFDPNETQQKLFQNLTQPGVYILEAPMGIGKTEAALYAAYKMMALGKATGIYFALPTQLTSDKIYQRFGNFLRKILSRESSHQAPLLLHGNAWLQVTDLGVDCRPGGSWFTSGKRGILAPFAVGTVDQALMAVMNVKHGFVRTFGLAGKVVILDEVHSYDAYTGTILDELVLVLQELGCTVIILSATLTGEKRGTLLGQQPKKDHYPLISVSAGEGLREISVEAPSNKRVAISSCQQDDRAVEEALYRAEQGQQVLWIENTVKEAQRFYKLLAARAGELNISCGLLHSHFIKSDRNHNETYWVKLYGKEPGKKGEEIRQLQGRILVGTQVLEQSLDIDADFLVTRICPTDMLLQRIGRLWRHQKTERLPSAKCEAWILSPAFADALESPQDAFGNTANVYSPYVLCRTLEVWEKIAVVNLPSQIRSLIEETYCERVEKLITMQRSKSELVEQKEKLQRLALVGISQGGMTLPENKASTRYNDQETVEVLLLRSCRHQIESSITYVTLLNGEEIALPKNLKAQSRTQWFTNAALLTQNTVRIAERNAPYETAIKNLEWLKDYFYLGDKNQQEALLRVALVQENGELISISKGPAHDSLALYYDSRIGYYQRKK